MTLTMARPRKKPAAVKRLRDADLLRLAIRFARLARLKKRAELKREEVQQALLVQLGLRQANKLQLGDTSITRVQQKPSASYDEAALLKGLKPRQRNLIIQERVDLNRLPGELRTRFEASLSKEERAAITVVSIDTTKLEAEVTAGRISAELVTPHKRIHEKAPYILVTGG